jgi:hypothetical protein
VSDEQNVDIEEAERAEEPAEDEKSEEDFEGHQLGGGLGTDDRTEKGRFVDTRPEERHGEI